MSSEDSMVIPGQALEAVLGPLTRLVTAVQSAPLTQAALRERWGNPDERTFQRWCKELRLVPLFWFGRRRWQQCSDEVMRHTWTVGLDVFQVTLARRCA